MPVHVMDSVEKVLGTSREQVGTFCFFSVTFFMKMVEIGCMRVRNLLGLVGLCNKRSAAVNAARS